MFVLSAAHGGGFYSEMSAVGIRFHLRDRVRCFDEFGTDPARSDITCCGAQNSDITAYALSRAD